MEYLIVGAAIIASGIIGRAIGIHQERARNFMRRRLGVTG